MVFKTLNKERLCETRKPPSFVYYYCRFLNDQRGAQRAISTELANDFENDNEPLLEGEDA